MSKLITSLSILLLANTNNLFTMSLSDLMAKQKQLTIAKATHSKLFLSLEHDSQIKAYYAKRQEIINQLKQVTSAIKTKGSDNQLSHNELLELDKTFNCLLKLYGKKQLLDATKDTLIRNALDFKSPEEFYKTLANVKQQNYLVLVSIAKVQTERNKILNQSRK